jgi:hypothetical protein
MELSIHPGTDLGDLLPLCDELYESTAVDELAQKEIIAAMPRLRPAIAGEHDWRSAETYTVVFIEEIDGHPKGEDLLKWPLLAKLLVGEASSKRLARSENADLLAHAHSYFEDDLAVIDWNSAVVLEPSGSRDIPDILEFATSQLLKLRYYDGVFDKHLARIYDDLAQAQRAGSVLRSPYRHLARNVLGRVVELNEFAERVDNALKIIGDFYLARVYETAVRRFRISAWQGSIDGKQALVAQAYDLIKGEIDVRRATLLELVIIILLLFEVAKSLLPR